MERKGGWLEEVKIGGGRTNEQRGIRGEGIELCSSLGNCSEEDERMATVHLITAPAPS